jgi:ribulose-phosphate 3-epimerase
MSAIVPAILPKSLEDLQQKLAVLDGVVTSVQLDVVDGRFASPASWPYLENSSSGDPDFQNGETLPYLGQMNYEIDLMVSNPEEVTGLWIQAGASRITIHAESTKYLSKTISDVQVKYGHAKDFAPGLLSLGLAINIATDLSLIEPYLEFMDYVQFMGIASIGKQGEPYDTRVLRKIAAFRHLHPDMNIQVDGGVSLATAPALLSAGVSRLIIGSALWKAPNLLEEFRKFQDLSQEYGIYS